MSIIKMLGDRIKSFEFQQLQLGNERDEIIEKLKRVDAKIEEYQKDINEMQIAIEKLEKETN